VPIRAIRGQYILEIRGQQRLPTRSTNTPRRNIHQMNPFHYGNIVSGEFFYDRKEELQRITQTLKGGNNLMLYAPRRYGKSSLVAKALKELEKEGFATVYLDFMSVYSGETFIRNYTTAITRQKSGSFDQLVRKMAGLINGIVPAITFDNQGNPSFSFSWVEGHNTEQTLKETIDLPERLSSSNKRWIVAFDEFQEITKLNGESFEKILRSCIQHHKNVSYLFLGSRTHLLKDMFNNKNRAFYHAAMLMNIETINDADSAVYLQHRFGKFNIQIDESTAHYLIQKVASIPYYIQFVAAEIWQQQMGDPGSKSITRQQVDTAIDSILNIKADYYWELINKQTNYRKKVLFALSHAVDEIFSKSTTEKYRLGPVSTTQKALDTFIEEGMIERINNKYHFSDPIFKLFLMHHL